MRSVALGEIAELRAGVGFPPRLQGRASGDYPLAKVGDISRVGRSGSSAIITTDNFVDHGDLETLRMKPVSAGAVLFAKIGEAIRHNHRAVAGRPMLIDNNAMAAIPDVAVVDPRYLYRFLQSVDFYSMATSTTVPSLRKSDLQMIRVPCPAIAEQRRIAAILDHADALRAKRRQVLAHLDTLTQSIFREMFEDGRSTPTRRLGSVADIASGITKGRRTKDTTRKVPYLAVANVQLGHLKLDTVKEIEATDREIDRYRLMDGDIVMTEGGDPDKLGRAAIWRSEIPDCLHQNHIFRVRLVADVLPIFLSSFLASRPARSYFLRSAKQTTGIASINMTQLKALPVPIPALNLQREFVARVELVEAQRSNLNSAIVADDQLFASLQSRAFRGEL